MGNSELMQLEWKCDKTLVSDVRGGRVCGITGHRHVCYTQGTVPASTLVRGALVRDGCALPCCITCKIFIM